jgi:hypothetical protein
MYTIALGKIAVSGQHVMHKKLEVYIINVDDNKKTWDQYFVTFLSYRQYQDTHVCHNLIRELSE